MKTIPTLFLTATTALLPLSASTPPPTAPASAAVQEAAEEEIPSGPTLEEIGQIAQAICAHPQAKEGLLYLGSGLIIGVGAWN